VVGRLGDGSPEFVHRTVGSSQGRFHRSRPW
jgi:hypothetical protein